MADREIEAVDGAVPPMVEPPTYRQHYVAADLTGERPRMLAWGRTWERDPGTAKEARFGSAEEAERAGWDAGSEAPTAMPWPTAVGGPTRSDAGRWWLSGEADGGGMEHGSWPFMVCEGEGAEGAPYRTVAQGIQDASEAHLLRSARELRSALEACVAAMRLLDGSRDEPAPPVGRKARARRMADAAVGRAEAALAASRGRTQRAPSSSPGCTAAGGPFQEATWTASRS